MIGVDGEDDDGSAFVGALQLAAISGLIAWRCLQSGCEREVMDNFSFLATGRV